MSHKITRPSWPCTAKVNIAKQFFSKKRETIKHQIEQNKARRPNLTSSGKSLVEQAFIVAFQGKTIRGQTINIGIWLPTGKRSVGGLSSK